MKKKTINFAPFLPASLSLSHPPIQTPTHHPKCIYLPRHFSVLVHPSPLNCFHVNVSTAKSLCYGSGDPHYHTHDGAVIDYQGLGWFIMSSLGQLDECQHLKGFELLVQQEKRPRWPNVAFIRTIRFTLTSWATTVKIEKYGDVSVSSYVFF